ncbi:MAG: glyoxalase [Chloroflexi bacterium]|nr:MAG: glyoxalase [Chloroflexota bacterium]
MAVNPPEINAILIGVKDLGRSKKFYAEGLGCPIENDYPMFVSFKLGDGSPTLGLYPREALAADAGVAPEGSGFSGVTLHYIVKATERVDEVLAQAERAGAKIVKPAQKAQWGYFGYFADPDGHLWKVAAGQ